MEKVLKKFNKEKIDYCLLRNFESLSGELDIGIHRLSLEQSYRILIKQGFERLPQQFSLKHIGYSRGNDTFDIQIDGIYWNDMIYLSSNKVFWTSVKKKGFYTLGQEASFIMYICHSILGKRKFKKKYRNELIKLSKEDLNFESIVYTISRVFGEKATYEIIANVRMNKFNELENRIYYYLVCFLKKKPSRLFIFIPLCFRWLFSRRKGGIKMKCKICKKEIKDLKLSKDLCKKCFEEPHTPCGDTKEGTHIY